MLDDGKWESAWKAKLGEFEKTVKNKTGSPAKKFINEMTRYSSLAEIYRQLDAAFKTMDAARRKKDLTLLVKAMKNFRPHILKTTASGNILLANIKSSKASLKKEHPWSAQAFDILSKFIDASIAGAESAYADSDRELAILKNKWSLLSSKQSRDEKEIHKFKVMLKKNLLKEIKSGLVWAKEQEVAPNVTTYNDDIEKETYNLFRYMNEYRGKCDRNTQEFKDVDKAIRPVDAWRNNKTLPETAGGDQVIIALGKLRTMLADIARWANQL
ncbi:hypothetical protein [Roseibium algae]|uniref:Uncharacterized protein n=1 Tax=Roseibium algae TaxID=3123038 RepID=A0ABU8TE57_9HYPH